MLLPFVLEEKMSFNENEHPRDEDGKFTDGAGEGSAAKIRRAEEKAFPDRFKKTGQTPDEKAVLTKKLLSGMIRIPLTFFSRTPEEQFGKKVGKHAKDFGLDPSQKEHREIFRRITEQVLENPDEIRRGYFRGQSEEVLFYAKDGVVVMTKLDGEYISTMEGGISNERFKNAIRQ